MLLHSANQPVTAVGQALPTFSTLTQDQELIARRFDDSDADLQVVRYENRPGRRFLHKSRVHDALDTLVIPAISSAPSL